MECVSVKLEWLLTGCNLLYEVCVVTYTIIWFIFCCQSSSLLMSRSYVFMWNLRRVKNLSICGVSQGKEGKSRGFTQWLPFFFFFFKELGWCYTLQLTLLVKMKNCIMKDFFFFFKGNREKKETFPLAPLGIFLSNSPLTDVVHSGSIIKPCCPFGCWSDSAISIQPIWFHFLSFKPCSLYKWDP